MASIYHLAKAGQEAQLVTRLADARTLAASSPLPGVSPSVLPTLPTAPPTATPTPLPSSSASGAAVAVASGSPRPAASAASPSASPSAHPSPSASASANASAPPVASPSASPTPRVAVDPALALALYKVDPSTYAHLFVENYPIDETGVQGDYGARLARARLTRDGTRFPIAAIARLAGAGDPVAVVRMLAATASSSGAVAAQYADAVAYVAAKNPDGFVTGLEALPMGIRMRVASTSHWCLIRPKTLLAAIADDPGRVAMQNVIRTAMGSCRATPARHGGRPHHGKANGHGKSDKKTA